MAIPDRNLWLAAVAAQLGDVATTIHGISALGATEQNPVAQHIFEAIGLVPGMVTIKLVLFAIAILAYHIIPEIEWTVPSILVVIGGFVTASNLTQILLLA